MDQSTFCEDESKHNLRKRNMNEDKNSFSKILLQMRNALIKVKNNTIIWSYKEFSALKKEFQKIKREKESFSATDHEVSQSINLLIKALNVSHPELTKAGYSSKYLSESEAIKIDSSPIVSSSQNISGVSSNIFANILFKRESNQKIIEKDSEANATGNENLMNNDMDIDESLMAANEEREKSQENLSHIKEEMCTQTPVDDDDDDSEYLSMSTSEIIEKAYRDALEVRRYVNELEAKEKLNEAQN